MGRWRPPIKKGSKYITPEGAQKLTEEVQYLWRVGPDEFNVVDGKLSMDSPLGKAMLGKRVEDEIEFSSPKGLKVFYISKIRYFER